MEKEGDSRDNLTPCRRLDFELENNIPDHSQFEINGEEEVDEFVDLEEKENKMDVHDLISEDMIPKVGKEFDSEELAFQFYNNYALASGFSVRRSDVHRDRHRNIIDRTFCCSCEGYRPPDKRDVIVKAPRPETRFGCGARMKINCRHSSKYRVVEFVAKHSGHQLVTPRKGHLLRSHRNINDEQGKQLDDIDKAGIPPKQGLDFLAQQAGGRQKVGYILEDVKNYLRSQRTMQTGKDVAGGVLNYLQRKQSEDPNFFYAIQLDKDDLITNIFWVDGQMMVDYMYFGDVVSFDTTYGKLKDARPFAMFVGVNHHKQTTLFGAALLYDETAETFKWLFDTFVKVMNGKKPRTILTDQHAAMAKALKEKWPDVCHRLCIWHIYQNAAIHLNPVFKKFSSFVIDFSSCIYDYEEEKDFIDAWKRMLNKYGLQKDDWLERLFKKKEKWALVCERQTFCADLITTQRSESMNSAMKKYVSSKQNLMQFIHHFGRLIDDRRYEEMKVDLRTNGSVPTLSFPVEILKHARTVYTHEVFKLFQEELSKAYDSHVEFISELDDISRYEVKPFQKVYQHTVMYDPTQEKVSCSCKKFEFAGILCFHALKVLSLRSIVRIPEAYIMKRWTKIAKKGLHETCSKPPASSITPPENRTEETEKTRRGERYRDLCRLQNQLVARASSTEEMYQDARDNVIRMIEEMDICSEKESTQAIHGLNIGKDKAFVSRMTPSQSYASKLQDGQVFEVSDNLENSQENAEKAHDDVLIQGWKMKESSKRKSGKRIKSGLEQAVRKTKAKNNKNSSTVGYCPITSPLLQTTTTTPSLPSLPHLSQINTVAMPSWSTTHLHTDLHNPTTGYTFGFMPPTQMIELSNPNSHRSLEYCTQRREKSQNDSMNMTKLLQTQMLQRKDLGSFPSNGLKSETQPSNANDGGGIGP